MGVAVLESADDVRADTGSLYGTPIIFAQQQQGGRAKVVPDKKKLRTAFCVTSGVTQKKAA